MQLRLSECPALDAADIAACRALLANGSKSFFAASFLLPVEVRTAATALYAFCRLADDLVDDPGHSGHETAARELQERLDRAYAGDPGPVAADRAFAWVVRRYNVPRALPEALLEGFAWDAEGRRYETFEDLTAYAVRVAGTVGMMMSVLMGARSSVTLARACDLGVAMQLTNIARDVGEDARNGRIYLPLAWMRSEGIDVDSWLKRSEFSAQVAAVVQRLLAEADVFYAKSEAGIRQLPANCRPGIFGARYIYAEIGREVERAGLDSVSQRARVSGSRKVALLLRAAAAARLRGESPEGAPVAAASHLISAVDASWQPAQVHAAGELPAWWNLPARIARTVELFERLERDEREETKASAAMAQASLSPAQ